MSIINDIRIKQDIDKDGKYVCDLNQKKTETRPGIGTVIDASKNGISWNTFGVCLSNSTTITIPPIEFMNHALKWFEYSKSYKWNIPKLHKDITREKYIRNLIEALEDLI